MTWTNLVVLHLPRQHDTCDLDERWSQPSTDAAPTYHELTATRHMTRLSQKTVHNVATTKGT